MTDQITVVCTVVFKTLLYRSMNSLDPKIFQKISPWQTPSNTLSFYSNWPNTEARVLQEPSERALAREELSWRGINFKCYVNLNKPSGSTVPKCQKLCIRLVVGIARIPTLEKQSEGCMTEKLNILRGSQVPVMHLLSQTTSRQLVTTSNGTTLRYWQKVGLIPIVRLRRLYLFRNSNLP